MKMGRAELVRKIGDYRFAAVLEVSSAARYSHFVERAQRKRHQARHAKDYVDESFDLFEIQRASDAKEGVCEAVPDRFKVVSGIGLLTNLAPQFNRGSLDFFLSVYNADAFTLVRAYQHMLKHTEMEESERKVAKRLVEHSGKINLVELMKKNKPELREAAKILGMDPLEFVTIFRKVSGNITESYFYELFSEYIANATIIPQLKRYYMKVDKESGKKISRETDIDLLVACPEAEFYDALYLMARTRSISVDCDPLIMKTRSSFFE